MRWLFWLFAVGSGFAYYLNKIDQRSDLALRLIEFETQHKLQIWMILSFATAVCAVLWKNHRNPSTRSLQKHREDWLDKPKLLNAPEKTTKVRDNHYSQMTKATKSLTLPQGAKIIISPEDRYPIVLMLERCTPEMIRTALRLFADYVDQHPTPPSIQVRFIDVIDSGLPYTAQVLGAFRTHFTTEEMMIRGVENEVEVRFLCPDDDWIKNK